MHLQPFWQVQSSRHGPDELRRTLGSMSKKPLEEQIRALAEELSAFRDRVQSCRDGLPMSAQETGPDDILQPDEVTRARSTLECVLADHLDIALGDLLGLARSLGRRRSPRKRRV